ncbi:RNA polymerase sigma factor [Muricauda brasiliensis]|uniref:RNA polymerase sigma factor n=1 Tax=Muricauda brasiliensis TaxID=2162892 RepID=UPI00131F4757|nr:sigma-70 family RNA polymerase sigma factor [Muricauda brasiliensis]
MKQLIQEIKSGNKESFKEFFEDFYPILCSFAFKFLKTTDKSEDVAQEALVKYWERRDDFEDIKSVKNFLYVVTRNHCLNLLKQSKRDKDLDEINMLESNSFLQETLLDQETFHLVHKVVSELPDRQRVIIELTLKGIRNPEIALQLQITENTVKTSKRNAFRKLRELLKENYYLLLFI